MQCRFLTFLPGFKPLLQGTLLEVHDFVEEPDGLVGLGEEGDVAVRVVDGALDDGVVRTHLRDGNLQLGPVVQRGHLKVCKG